MKKLSNTDPELKKDVAYKKKRVFLLIMPMIQLEVVCKVTE